MQPIDPCNPADPRRETGAPGRRPHGSRRPHGRPRAGRGARVPNAAAFGADPMEGPYPMEDRAPAAASESRDGTARCDWHKCATRRQPRRSRHRAAWHKCATRPDPARRPRARPRAHRRPLQRTPRRGATPWNVRPMQRTPIRAARGAPGRPTYGPRDLWPVRRAPPIRPHNASGPPGWTGRASGCLWCGADCSTAPGRTGAPAYTTGRYIPAESPGRACR